MGMGSGGMVIIEMQRQMNAARGGQDSWGALVFATGIYALAGALEPYLAAGVLVLGVAVRVRQDHLLYTMIDALDPEVRTSFPWQLWALIFGAVVVVVQLGTIVLLEPLLQPILFEGAGMAALMLALVPVALTYLAGMNFIGPVRLGQLTEWFLGLLPVR